MINIEEIRKDFPIFSNRAIAYLDSGATTQKPIQVIEKINEFYNKNNANPHRGAYSLSMEATSEYEKARSKVSKFINSRYSEEIIFTKNATESLNLIAYSYGMENLKQDDEIVISIMEHHSNLVPWQKVSKVTNSKLNYMYINENFEISDEEISFSSPLTLFASTSIFTPINSSFSQIPLLIFIWFSPTPPVNTI